MKAALLKTFLLLFAFFSALAGNTASAAAQREKTNFIFILADDLGWTDLACYGSAFYQTPNIDALAAEGMKFTDAYAAAPVCSPTRAAFLTGRHPARLRLTDWIPGKAAKPEEKVLTPDFKKELSTEELTLAEILQSAGYVCASIGKWHLGRATARHHGFDVDIAGSGAGTPGSYFSPYKSSTRAVPLVPGPEGEYLTDRLTDEALAFIQDNRDKPFLLYLPHYTPHIPLQAKADLIEKYRKLLRPDAPHNNAVYAAMIESLDVSVGRIVAKVRELNMASRTVILFTSDNGGVTAPQWENKAITSNAPLREGKGHIYEGGIRVPLIVSWPGGIKPGISDAPVTTLDFLPTMLELAGVKTPGHTSFDGESLVPLFKGGKLKRKELFWHYPHYSPQGGLPAGAVREGDFKLIDWYEDGRVELFNLRKDIGERTDLAPAMKSKAAALKKKLDAWRRDVNAQMPTLKAE